jgi:hypothetical protein
LRYLKGIGGYRLCWIDAIVGQTLTVYQLSVNLNPGSHCFQNSDGADGTAAGSGNEIVAALGILSTDWCGCEQRAKDLVHNVQILKLD